MKTSQLRKIIRESIKGLLIEQTTADCQQIYALTDPASNLDFPGCCETTQNWVNWDPNQMDDPCKMIQAQASAINSNFAACCDPNFGTGSILDCSNEGIHAGNASGKCWACRQEGDVPAACQQLSTMGMTPLQAQAANITLYNDEPTCTSNSDCGDGGNQGDMVQCFCCDGQDAQSMVQQVPAVPGCSAMNGGNLSGCVLHTNSGGTWDKNMCKKPGIPTSPNLPSKMKPNSGDMRRAIREIKRRINNISKK